MPFEDITINATEQVVMKKSGFQVFPFAVNRWEVGDQEKWGYGCGVQALSDIKDIQQGRKDYQECCQRLLRPAYLTRDIEGSVNMLPDGRTEVTDVDRDVKALSMALPGAFPVNKDELEWRQGIIDSFFYVDVWNMFTSMTGDRRTTLEIQLKYREGLRMVGSPSSRQQVELFSPTLENIIYLLIENGRIERPPSEIIGLPYSLEYQGELAMAMKESQSRGFERAMTLMANGMTAFPDMKYQINIDRAMPDILTTYGMKIEHLNTPEEKAALRAKDDEREQMMAQLAQLQTQSESYKNTQKSPEQGSPAAEMAGV
jgi:Bacteriophage head to tail connecting protein